MTAVDTLKQVLAIRPDVAVPDVNLSVGNGIEVCRELRSSVPGLRCLMITAGSDDDALFAALSSAIELSQLTSRQREIFGLVLRGRTNAEIAARLGVAEVVIVRHSAVLLTTLGLRRRLLAASYEANRIS